MSLHQSIREVIPRLSQSRMFARKSSLRQPQAGLCHRRGSSEFSSALEYMCQEWGAFKAGQFGIVYMKPIVPSTVPPILYIPRSDPHFSLSLPPSYPILFAIYASSQPPPTRSSTSSSRASPSNPLQLPPKPLAYSRRINTRSHFYLALSTFSILKCAELMVAKSVMAIPEALAPTLCFSTTA